MDKLLYLFITVLCVSCGIPEFVYLEKPLIINKAHSTSEFAVFQNSVDNDPKYFLGFDVYYKFYNKRSTLKQTVKRLKNCTRNTLVNSYAFSKLYRVEKQDLSYQGLPGYTFPVKINKTKPFRVMVNLMNDQDENNTFETYIGYLIGQDIVNNKIYLCRYPKQNRIKKNQANRIARSFAPDNFSINDGDLPQKITGNKIYMILYVCSLGYDNNIISLFSDPLYLGEFEFEIKEGVFND